MSGSHRESGVVLVTGAAGFIGRHTLRPLTDRGFRVIAITRGAPGPELLGVEWRQAGLLSARAVPDLLAELRPSHMLAAAWHMAPGNMQALENFRWLQRSIDHLLAFAKVGGRRVVFVGSCAEYDWSRGRMSELETPLRPSSPYGAAKLALFTAFGSICAATGIFGAWARPFFMYGPGETPRRLVADVTLSLLRGEEALCTHGRQRRDFLHVADVGDALAAILAADIEGPVNVGSGAAVAIADLAGEIARQLDAPALLRLGARQAPPDDPALIEADIARLCGELGWRPKFDMASGIADTIRWWRDNPPEGAGA